MRKTELEQQIAGYMEQLRSYPEGDPEYVRITGEILSRQTELRVMWMEAPLSKDLKGQLAEVQEEIAHEKQKGFAKDFIFISDLEMAEASILKAMDEEALQLKAERIETAKEEAVNYIDSDDALKDLPQAVRDLVQLAVEIAVKKEQDESAQEQLALVEKHNEKVKLLIDQGLEVENQRVEAEDKAEKIQNEYDGLDLHSNEQQGIIDDHIKTIAQLTLERDQALLYRDNAVDQINHERQKAMFFDETASEYYKEIQRLQGQINEYQTAKVFGEREQQRIIQVQADERMKEAIERVKKEFIVVKDDSRYPQIMDAEGNKETVHITELQELTIVPEFTADTVDLSDVVIETEPFQPETVPSEEQPNSEGTDVAEGQAESEPVEEQTNAEGYLALPFPDDSGFVSWNMFMNVTNNLAERIVVLENSHLRLE